MSLEQALVANTEAVNNLAALLAAANLGKPALTGTTDAKADTKDEVKTDKAAGAALPPKAAAEAAQKGKQVPGGANKAPPAAATEKKPETAEQGGEVTYDMAKAALLAVVKKKGSAAAAAALAECGLKTLSDEGAAEKYADALTKLTAVLEAKD